MGYIIGLLIVSQIISFYLIFKKINPLIIKEKVKGIVLSPMPKDVSIENVGGTNELVRDLMKTVLIEGWDVTIKKDYKAYGVEMKSNNNITIYSRIRVDDYFKPDLDSFRVVSSGGGYHTLNIYGKSSISNEILAFLWDFIIKDKEKENELINKKYNTSVNGIRSKLKTVNRDNKLNDLGI